jgi:hypothetical protein
MAKSTSDPDLAAKLVGAAADLKDQAGELPAPTKPPDVLMEEWWAKGRLSLAAFFIGNSAIHPCAALLSPE